MDRSRFSNVVSVTRLLPHFSQNNINVIKECIFEQLGCENECDFICRSLNSLYKTMSVESTAIMKNKAIEIADKQPVELALSTTKSKTNSIDTTNTATAKRKNHITVYKHIQQQYNDRLSRLHSDIIDYFATFLSKKQSIEFGYLNKQLFIETQKESYLLKRSNDAMFEMTDTKLDSLISRKNDGFNYSFGQELKLSFGKKFVVSRIPITFFNNWFRQINILKCCSYTCLSYIPVQLLFNSKNIPTIAKLGIEVPVRTTIDKHLNHVNVFCSKLEKYKNQCLQLKIAIRNIKRLEIGMSYNFDSNDTQTGCGDEIIRELLLHCGSISESIYFSFGTNPIIKLENVSQLNTIFHQKLKNFYFARLSSFQATFPNEKKANGEENDSGNDEKKKIGNLQTIGIAACYWNDLVNNKVLHTLDFFDMFSMRYNVQCYTIDWSGSCDVDNNLGQNELSIDILNKIFFQDYDKHPFLSKIEICLTCDEHLCCLAKLLLYFSDHYKQLFIERKFDLAHFKKIKINFKGDQGENNTLIQSYEHLNGDLNIYNVPTRELTTMFDQTSNQNYSTDKMVVEIKHVNQGIESFGVIYQNVVSWLQARQIQYGEPYHEAVTGCKLVFTID